MKKFVFVMALLFVSAANADESKATDKANAVAANASKADDGYKCERRNKVGTNIPVRVCTTAAQRREAREFALKVLDGTGREIR